MDEGWVRPGPKVSKPRRTAAQKFEFGRKDQELTNELRAWRRTAFTKRFPHQTSLAADLFMSDHIVERLVGLAHNDKLHDEDKLVRDVDWVFIGDYATELLALIFRIYPPPPPLPALPASSSMHARLSSIDNDPSSSTEQPSAPSNSAPKRTVRCGACGMEGHNGTSLDDLLVI